MNIFARIRFSTLGRRDIPASTTTEVIGWWETRRIPFNLIVGTAGVLTCIIIGIVGLGSWIFWGSDIGMPNSPLLALFGVVLYGFVANVCYTCGWLTELVIRKLAPETIVIFMSSQYTPQEAAVITRLFGGNFVQKSDLHTELIPTISRLLPLD